MDILTNLLAVVVIVIWMALIYWTWSDAKRRISDRFLVACATAAALFPFIGSLIYLIVRPPEYLEDVRERELEIAASEATISAAHGGSCPHCDARVGRDFLRCPSCARRLREPCPKCSRAVEPDWRVCPWCEAELAALAVPESPTSARRKRSAGGVAAGERGGRAAKSASTGGSRPSAQRKSRAGSAAKAAPARASKADGPDAVKQAPSSGGKPPSKRPAGSAARKASTGPTSENPSADDHVG